MYVDSLYVHAYTYTHTSNIHIYVYIHTDTNMYSYIYVHIHVHICTAGYYVCVCLCKSSASLLKTWWMYYIQRNGACLDCRLWWLSRLKSGWWQQQRRRQWRRRRVKANGGMSKRAKCRPCAIIVLAANERGRGREEQIKNMYVHMCVYK